MIWVMIALLALALTLQAVALVYLWIKFRVLEEMLTAILGQISGLSHRVDRMDSTHRDKLATISDHTGSIASALFGARDDAR